MNNSLKKNAIVLLFLTMPLVGYGTHLQAVSPNLQFYQKHQIDIVVAENPDKDLAPGYGLGLVMASAWPFTVLMQGVMILVFITSTLFVRALTKRIKNRNISWATFVAFVGFWIFGIFMLLRTAIENFMWDFTLLAIAQILTSIGLMIGSIGLFKEISNELLKRDAA